ncbi:MAG: HlyD family efflux transporter periplasmic adaptor subunit [Planctomycetes bacterium]|nr:HlyD family efflux transporter periplasmic adaptor subunit [Planctomycetota bacterium]
MKSLADLSLNPTQGTETIPHPPRKWFSRILLPVTIVVVALALLGYGARHSLQPATDVRIVRAVGKSLANTTGSVTVQAPGWVEADPFSIYVPALAPGIVEEVLVLEGEPVEAGQVVVRMIKDDARLAVDMTEALLKDALAQLDTAQANLTAAQSDWDHPIEQDRAVAAGQAFLQQAMAAKAQLESEVVMHKATLDELTDNHKRLYALLPDAAAQQQVVQSAFKRDAQNALLVSVEKKHGVVDARIRGLQANLDAANEHRRLRIPERKNLDTAVAEVARLGAQVMQAEVGVAQAHLRLERMDVRSTVAGIVMTRLVVPGSKLMLDMDSKLSANAIHLYDPNKLQVRVDVPLADTAKVGLNQKAKVTVDVLPDTRFDGHVTRIVHEADIQKNTLQVKVAIHDPIAKLKPEMLARVRFIANRPENSIEETSLHTFVPERLIMQRADETATVWLVTAARRATLRSITLGEHVQDKWIEVIAGLNPGDVLIADPSDTLKEGQRVRITGEANL